MRETSGRKQMVVLTQGMAGTRDLPTLFEPVVTAAARSGVQLAVLTEHEDDLDMSSQPRTTTVFGQSVGGTGIEARRREDRLMFIFGLQTLADMSGGAFERVISNSDGAFRRVAASGSGVYRLGVELPPDAGVRTLVVEAAVTRSNLRVRVNRRAVGPASSGDATAGAKVAAAIKEGARYDGVPIRMSVAKRRTGADRIELAVDLQMRPRVAGPMRVTIGLLDAAGRLTQGTDTVEAAAGTAAPRHTVAMPVAAGTHRLRVAVEDAGGNVGSVSAPIEARLNRMGPLDASDLLMWRKDAAGRPQMLALDRMPDGLQALNAGVELYPVAGARAPGKLSVVLSIVPAGASTPLAEVSVTPVADGDVRRAQATLPLSQLPAGSYLIRATVLAEGQRLGEVSATIERQ
jgi:hypothetical protein